MSYLKLPKSADLRWSQHWIKAHKHTLGTKEVGTMQFVQFSKDRKVILYPWFNETLHEGLPGAGKTRQPCRLFFN